MSKKSFITFIVIFILSIVAAIGLPVLTFSNGFPLPWSRFSFLGSEENYTALMIDIVFWFIVILVGWKIIEKLWHQRQKNS